MSLPLPKNRRGRKRKSGHRMPSGRVRREPEDPRLVVMAQPHRRGLPPTQSGDQRLENYLGNLHFIGAINSRELAAGRWYQQVVARWRAVMSVADPTLQPVPANGGHIPAEEARRRIEEYNDARKALEATGPFTVSTVDNFVLLNQPLPERGFRVLLKGLRGLAFVRENIGFDEPVS